MKQTLLCLVIAAGIVAYPVTSLALAGGPTLVAQASKTSVSVNETFTVSVVLNTKTYEVSGVDMKVTFPSSLLQAQSIAAGTFLPTVLTAGATGTGTATIAVGSGSSYVTGSGTIAIITFKALAAGTPQITFSSDTLIAAKGQSGNVVDTMTPVTVTVSGAAATAQASPVKTAVAQQATKGGSAARVSTGPGESSIMALIVSAIVTLLYVGYTATDTYRRHEVQDIAEQEKADAPDFKQ